MGRYCCQCLRDATPQRRGLGLTPLMTEHHLLQCQHNLHCEFGKPQTITITCNQKRRNIASINDLAVMLLMWLSPRLEQLLRRSSCARTIVTTSRSRWRTSRRLSHGRTASPPLNSHHRSETTQGRHAGHGRYACLAEGARPVKGGPADSDNADPRRGDSRMALV